MERDAKLYLVLSEESRVLCSVCTESRTEMDVLLEIVVFASSLLMLLTSAVG